MKLQILFDYLFICLFVCLIFALVYLFIFHFFFSLLVCIVRCGVLFFITFLISDFIFCYFSLPRCPLPCCMFCYKFHIDILNKVNNMKPKFLLIFFLFSLTMADSNRTTGRLRRGKRNEWHFDTNENIYFYCSFTCQRNNHFTINHLSHFKRVDCWSQQQTFASL